jgi:hypothetical protein
MQNFVRRENLRCFRKLLVKTTNETMRSHLFKLIAEEERRQILQRRDWSSLPTRKLLNHPAAGKRP